MTAQALLNQPRNTFIHLFENDYEYAWNKFHYCGIDFVISVTATNLEMIAWDTITETFHYADNAEDATSILLDAIFERS